MMFRLSLFIFSLALFPLSSYANQLQAPAQESDQQISEFSLAGYEEKGKKAWDLAGKTADIFDTVVKLKDVVGNLYGEDEDIKLTADRGDFDKTEGKVHLEENVVITTSSGSQLTTDSMDWDRKKQLVTTADPVNIVRDNMITRAIGAVGKPNLSRVVLHKDVQVDINPKEEEGNTPEGKNKIVIICDGPLEVDYARNIATFKNNVKVNTQDNLMYSDIMDIYFLSSSGNGAKQEKKDSAGFSLTGSKIDKIIARGHVKIIRGENVSYSQEATYTASDKKIVLTGRPKLILYSAEDMSAPFGN